MHPTLQATLRLVLAWSSLHASLLWCPHALGQDTGETTSPGEVPRPASTAESTQTSAERDAQAREEFRAGKAAYDANDFRTAWEHFRAAYVLSERPELLYNIGQAADRMQLRDQALTAFEMYLGKVPNAENAQEVRERIAALRNDVPEAPPETQGEADQSAGTTEQDLESGSNDDASQSANAGLRNGFLFHASAGLGIYLASWKATGDTSGSIRGAGIGLDVVIGYTLFPGWVVGGAALVNYQPSPTFRQGSDPTEGMDGQTFWMLGPTLAYYLSPNNHGGYAQVTLALAGATKARQEGAVGAPAGVAKASGGAIIVGGGYDIPFDGAFAYTFGGRIALATLTEAAISYTTLVPTITGGITWY